MSGTVDTIQRVADTIAKASKKLTEAQYMLLAGALAFELEQAHREGWEQCKAEVAPVLEILQAAQWSGEMRNGYRTCPSCGETQRKGHHQNCEIAQSIKAIASMEYKEGKANELP